MLTNGRFISSFVFTLSAIGVVVGFVVGFVVVVIIIERVWQLFQPFLRRLQRTWVANLIGKMGTISADVVAHTKRLIKGLLMLLVVCPWRSFIACMKEFVGKLREFPWGICVGLLGVGSLPFVVFASNAMPSRSIVGVVAAGALVGTFFAPFIGWRYRLLGKSKAIGISLLTIAGGAWSSSLLIAALIAMLSG